MKSKKRFIIGGMSKNLADEVTKIMNKYYGDSGFKFKSEMYAYESYAIYWIKSWDLDTHEKLAEFDRVIGFACGCRETLFIMEEENKK